jgi:hypothetical protein
MKCFVCDAKFSYRSDQPRDFVEWDSKWKVQESQEDYEETFAVCKAFRHAWEI